MMIMKSVGTHGLTEAVQNAPGARVDSWKKGLRVCQLSCLKTDHAGRHAVGRGGGVKLIVIS